MNESIENQLGKMAQAGIIYRQSYMPSKVKIHGLESLYGLEFVSDACGKVTSVTIDGDSITLEQGMWLRKAFEFGAIYFDVVTGCFSFESMEGVLANHLIDEVKAKIGIEVLK